MSSDHLVDILLSRHYGLWMFLVTILVYTQKKFYIIGLRFDGLIQLLKTHLTLMEWCLNWKKFLALIVMWLSHSLNSDKIYFSFEFEVWMWVQI
jgi:hypothetical protein